MRRVPRVYADTSVFGGVFDDEFAEPSRTFFDLVQEGRFRLVVSAAVQEEVANAPEQVQQWLADIAPLAEIVEVTEEATSERAPVCLEVADPEAVTEEAVAARVDWVAVLVALAGVDFLERAAELQALLLVEVPRYRDEAAGHRDRPRSADLATTCRATAWIAHGAVDDRAG